MAFSVISISSDSLEESVGTSTARIISFGTIPTTVPASAPTTDLPVIHDDTPLIPTDTPTISHIRSRVAAHSSPPSPPTRRILPTPPGLPRYFTHSDYSSSDHFTSDDSSRDSPSDPSSKTLLESHSDTSLDSSVSPTASVPVALLVHGALSPVRVDLFLPRNRIRDSNSMIDIEVDVDACITFSDDIAARGRDVRVEDATAAEEEAESSARGTIEIGVDRVTHLVLSDDTAKTVREDFPELVSAYGSLEVMKRDLDMVMQELYDHMVEIPVHRVRVIQSVERD
ncbi:hypothetical protein Tco_0157984 [Tanacetum coccineum]